MSWTRRHLALIGYLVLALGVAIGFYFLNQSRVALCALRVDLDSRIISQTNSITRGEAFLHDHPQGAFGFSKRDIQLSIDSQKRALRNSYRTRKALNAVRCGKTTG